MNKEEIQELMDYNLEYLEARNSEEIFGGDYTSGVDLKYANKEIDKLLQENKQLKERMDKAIEHTSLKMMRYVNEQDYLINVCDLEELLEILEKGSEE